MADLDDPFRAVEREIEACGLKTGADAILIDFHAEATSEKEAMGHFVDGRATALIGTHTHVPTADEQILVKAPPISAMPACAAISIRCSAWTRRSR